MGCWWWEAGGGLGGAAGGSGEGGVVEFEVLLEVSVAEIALGEY